jgi:hypothetical protein
MGESVGGDGVAATAGDGALPPPAPSAPPVVQRIPDSVLSALVRDVHEAARRMREVAVATLGEAAAADDGAAGGGAADGDDGSGGSGSMAALLLGGGGPRAVTGPLDAFVRRGGGGSGGGGGGEPPTSAPVSSSAAGGWLGLLSPLINSASVARVLHGVYSPVFAPADFRPAGQTGPRFWGGGGRGGGLWGRYAAYDFRHVADVAGRVLRHMARQEERAAAEEGGGGL